MHIPVLEIDTSTLEEVSRPLGEHPLRIDRTSALVAAAHETISRTLSTDSVEFLKRHRQRPGE